MKSTRKEALLAKESQYFTGVPCKHGHLAARRAKTGECLKCRALKLTIWRKENCEKVKIHNTHQYKKHSEKIKIQAKKYYIENSDVVKQKQREYQKKNISKYIANNAKRELSKKQRTPAWLTEEDYWMIEQAYELATLRTKLLGFPWSVDHVIPLQGKNVSGLHVPINLQVISAKANRQKSNRYEVT